MGIRQLFRQLASTVVTFFRKPQVCAGLCFMLFYRMPEGLLAKVSALFLIDAVHKGGLGLSPAEYGLVQGTVGVVGLTLGGILGGLAAGRNVKLSESPSHGLPVILYDAESAGAKNHLNLARAFTKS